MSVRTYTGFSVRSIKPTVMLLPSQQVPSHGPCQEPLIFNVTDATVIAGQVKHRTTVDLTVEQP